MANKIIDNESVNNIEFNIPELTSYPIGEGEKLPISLNVLLVEGKDQQTEPLIQLLTTDGCDILPEPLPREELMSMLWKVMKGVNNL